VSQHYSEADLLETYYTRPGESLPVMMHLADCEECATRYERLEKKVHGLAACAHDKPETFWARQRVSVMRKIDAERARAFSFARVSRVAAAAILTLSLGTFATWRLTAPSHEAQTALQNAPTQTALATVADDASASRLEESPWQSDELSDLHSMVEWESWVDDGDQSL
jgi:hypothetical protein